MRGVPVSHGIPPQSTASIARFPTVAPVFRTCTRQKRLAESAAGFIDAVGVVDRTLIGASSSLSSIDRAKTRLSAQPMGH